MNLRRRRGPVAGTLFHWDFLVSTFVTGLFLIVALSTGCPLQDATAVASVAAIPFGIALAAAALVASRWVADRVKDETYGEVLRSFDPDESHLQSPYLVVATVGLLTSLMGVFLFLVHAALNTTALAWANAALLFLVVYGILGFADLIRIGKHHQRRQARLRALHELEKRRKQA